MYSNKQFNFAWYEYLIFFSMILLTALIGIYIGLKRKNLENSVREYMFGGGKMPMLPIILSLIASFGSGIHLLGLPAEVYIYGTQIGAVIISQLIATAYLHKFVIPVIYNLKHTSIFEYLELRFNKTARTIGAVLFLFTVLNTPVVIYPPALALSQVSGISLAYIVPVICVFCIFYTTMGGLKAVAWSDALQSMFIAISLLAVLTLGVIQSGGLSNVIRIAEKGERLEFFNFDLDPFKRNTFWTVVVGLSFTWIKYFCFDPISFQRFSSVSSHDQVKKVAWIMSIGMIIFKIICLFSGLIIYANYYNCDPVLKKMVSKPGQILPYYALDIAGKYPGFNGIFLSGVTGTALSSLSSYINTLAGTIYEDFIKKMCQFEIKDDVANKIIKITVVVLGLASGLLVYLVQRMGTIMQGAIAINGIACGSTVFIYTYGMFYPWGNAKGAISGALVGVGATIWIAVGAHLALENGTIQYPGKTLSILRCGYNKTWFEEINTINGTSGFPGYGTKVIIADEVPYLYRTSFLYYPLVGFAVGCIVAVVVSALTGNQDLSKLDSNLIIPYWRFLLPHSKQIANYNQTSSKESVKLQENLLK